MQQKLDGPLWGRRIFFILLTIIGLLAFIYFFNINFKCYYKIQTINGELGYYSSKLEFYDLYKECIKDNSDRFEEINYINEEFIFSKKWIKDEYAKKFNNCSLIKKQLTTKYKIYKITIDKENEVYFPNKEEANDFVEFYKNKWEKAEILIEELIEDNLNLLSTQNEIDNITNKVTKNYYVASRSGINVRNLKTQRITNSNFISPSNSTIITSYYGMRTLNGVTKMHTGVDIGIPENSPVYASAAGTVIFSDWSGNYGYYIKIDHGNGIITGYAHNNELLYKVGDTVEKGEIIALSGSTGYSTGPHIHFEFIINGEFKNPLNYINLTTKQEVDCV